MFIYGSTLYMLDVKLQTLKENSEEFTLWKQAQVCI